MFANYVLHSQYEKDSYVIRTTMLKIRNLESMSVKEEEIAIWRFSVVLIGTSPE